MTDNFSPLANKLRPQTLEDFVGQKEAINKSSYLYQAIKKDKLPSLIFWGPPGSGKTTLAYIIAKETKAEFVKLSAVTQGLKDLREIIKRAEENIRLKQKTILFIDEIHRWNKSQQDALLPHVENGTVILIGATTENPSFSVNSALLSRTRIIVLEALTEKELEKILTQAEKKTQVKISSSAKNLMARLANNDARKALNILENLLEHKNKKEIQEKDVEKIMKVPELLYDKSGDEHYNLISALHKSMRGGDANASVYWLVRMLEGGEDPLYVARRLIRFASEDIGVANNSALMLTTSIYEACQNIGYPECGVNLAQGVIYLAKSKKSILAYQAYEEAKTEVKNSGNLPVPKHLRNAPTKLMKNLDYGKDYKYSPLENSEKQTYLPKEIINKKFIQP